MKQKLLEAVDEGRAVEAELERLVVDEPANLDGSWNAKDHLAHLAWWRRRSVQTMDALRTGGDLPPATPDTGDIQNGIIYAEVKDLPAALVKQDAGDTWAALRKVIENSSDEDLARHNPRQPDREIWETVPGDVGHSAVHVWSWLLDIGDEKRAIDVARWGAEIEGRFFSTPDKLAESRYNLACVYARIGDADQALPLLRQSFEAKPDLVEWARKDHDLDRIREELAPILN